MHACLLSEQQLNFLQFRSIKLIGFIDSGRGEKGNQLFSSSIDSFKRINEERVDFSLLNQTILLSWRPVCWPEAHNQLSFQREANPPREKRKVFISFHLFVERLKWKEKEEREVVEWMRAGPETHNQQSATHSAGMEWRSSPRATIQPISLRKQK